MLEEIPNDVTSLNITLYNKGKRSSSKDTEVAELTIELNRLKNGQETEDWYGLNGLTVSGREDASGQFILACYLICRRHVAKIGARFGCASNMCTRSLCRSAITASCANC